MPRWTCGVLFVGREASSTLRRVERALAATSDVTVEPVASDAATSELARFDVLIVGVEPSTVDACIALTTSVLANGSGCPLIAILDGLDGADLDRLVDAGIDDFVASNADTAELVARLKRAVTLHRPPALPVLRSALGERVRELVGTSPAFVSQVAKLPTLAGCDAGVLVLGETGTGKEVCAHAVHYLSSRASKPWVALNCAAIPTDLLESELFGHVKGAFTMAYQARKGLVSEAEGGTLFLDDIDCLPLPAQAKLLRFLEQREYRPVGSNGLSRADVRIIAASNDRLPDFVASGAFRQDLFFRLSVLSLKLPPLRRRREDIPGLANHFAAQFAMQFSRGAVRIAPSAHCKLLLHAWPGNVRELKHVIERAVLMSTGPVIEAADIDIDGAADGAFESDDSFGTAKSRFVETFERSYIELMLARCRGNVSHAARAAKKNRRAFFELMRKHGIDAGRFRAPAN